jgi:hypothetical protein
MGTAPVKTLLVEGRLEKRQGATHRPEQCRVFIPGHHLGYIDWATYEENQRMTRRNSANWQGGVESMSAIRAGQSSGWASVAGIVVANYTFVTGASEEPTRYLCKGDYDDGGQYCIGFGGASVDRQLIQLLKVISLWSGSQSEGT